MYMQSLFYMYLDFSIETKAYLKANNLNAFKFCNILHDAKFDKKFFDKHFIPVLFRQRVGFLYL